MFPVTTLTGPRQSGKTTLVKTAFPSIKTYVERDVRKIINIKDLKTFQRFLKICADRIGHVLNLNSICNDLGINNNTAKNWLNVLEASYIVYTLPPYFENFGKRQIKSPKLYFTDVGIACYLLEIKTKEHLNTHPLRGEIFENFVVMEFLKLNANLRTDHDFYYFRDNHQNEVDLLFQKNNKLIPIEIKSSETFNKSFLKGIDYFQKISKKSLIGYLIYQALPVGSTETIDILNYINIEKIFN